MLVFSFALRLGNLCMIDILVSKFSIKSIILQIHSISDFGIRLATTL